jgi:hypothetical protein
MENQNNEDPSSAELSRTYISEALWTGREKAVKISERPEVPGSPLGKCLQLGEIVLSTAKPLAKALLYGMKAFVETFPRQQTTLTSYEDENGNIKWGYFPTSSVENAKSDPGKTEKQAPNQTPGKMFDFKKDKAERQQASQHRGQTSVSSAAKITSQTQSRGTQIRSHIRNNLQKR